MVAFKVNSFGGLTPRFGKEDINDNYAQTLNNVNFYSADLVPFRKSRFVEKCPANTKTIYPLYNEDGSIQWLSFGERLDIVQSPVSTTNQRFYITGFSNERPKVSDKDLYPEFYDLGIPKPNSAPTATLGGGGSPPPLARAYVYTLVSEWGEEGPPSDASNIVTANEGETVTLSGFQVTQPNFSFQGNISNAAGFPLSGTVQIDDYYSVTADVTDEDDIRTNTGQSFKAGDNIAWTGNGWKKIIETSRKQNIKKKRIYRTVTGTDQPAYQFVAEIDLDDPSYTDTSIIADLGEELETLDFNEPDEELNGLISLPNGVFVGFVGKDIYFSEPYLPYTYPAKYSLSVDSDIVGLAPMGGNSFLVCTERFPYKCTGNTPDVMTIEKLEMDLPCVSKESIVDMGEGSMYASRAGLVLTQESNPIQLITNNIHHWESFKPYNPENFYAALYDSKYMASYQGGSIVFDLRSPEFISNITQRFSAAYYEQKTGRFFYVFEDEIKEFNSFEEEKRDIYYWKSKKFIMKDFMNFGAARVFADYTANMVTEDSLYGANDEKDGKAPYNKFAYNEKGFNKSDIEDLPLDQDLCVFLLYANGKLVFKKFVINDKVFRMPAGYKSDVMEFEIRSNIRVREVHIGETPVGLKGA